VTQTSYLADLPSELAETPDEGALISHALELLAYAPEPVAPLPGLRERVLARVASPPIPAQFEAGGFFFARGEQLAWTTIAPGVRIKWLWSDPATGARTGLIDMDPDRPFPEHPHPEVEDLFLISGEAWVGDVAMRAGDYCRSPGGTAHNDVRSGPNGAAALVVSR
jgi:hypothetical protein